MNRNLKSDERILILLLHQQGSNISQISDQLNVALPPTPELHTSSSKSEGTTESHSCACKRTTHIPLIKHTEDVIARVYNYLQTEYEQLKSSIGASCDLSPLANVLRRTALATGVSEQAVSVILEERKRAADEELDAVAAKHARLTNDYGEYVSSVPDHESSCGAPVKEEDDDEQTDDDSQEQDECELKMEIKIEDESDTFDPLQLQMSEMESVAGHTISPASKFCSDDNTIFRKPVQVKVDPDMFVPHQEQDECELKMEIKIENESDSFDPLQLQMSEVDSAVGHVISPTSKFGSDEDTIVGKPVQVKIDSKMIVPQETKEKIRKRNREYQRAWRQRQKDLKKKVSKKKKEEDKRKRHRENQRAYYQRTKRLLENYKNVEELSQKKLDDLQMKRNKLDSNEDQENVVQCRASQNLENVQLEQNQFLTQQFRIYVESHECITPKVILHRNTDIEGYDGNCLFLSLIRALQLPILTCELRRQLRDSPYLNSCNNPQEAYNILSSNNEYGNWDCLYLFAKIYNQNICVHIHNFKEISENKDTRFCHFKANDTHNWIHLDLRGLHFTPYISDDEKKNEDERKQKQRRQKNKEYSKRYRDKKRTSNLQTGLSARDMLDVQPVIQTLQIAGPSTAGVLNVQPVICSR